MADLIITTENSIADDSLVEIDPGTNNQFISPSTMRKENKVQAGHVSFAINLQLTQASATNQEGHIVLQGNNVEDVWPGNELGNKNTGRNWEGNHLSDWQDQDNEDNNTLSCWTAQRMMVSLQRHVSNWIAARISWSWKQKQHTSSTKKLKEEDTFSPIKHVGIFGDQHVSFPFLAISKSGNQVVVPHGIWKLVVPFLYSHKNNDDTIAFCGDIKDKQIFPKIVKLKEHFFEEAWDWPHPKIQMIMNVTDSKMVLQLPLSWHHYSWTNYILM